MQNDTENTPESAPAENEPGTLAFGETHPAAHSAFTFVKEKLLTKPMWIEAIASTALSGDRMAEIYYETARRIMAGEPVSDRYLLGLAWMFNMLENGEKNNESR